MEPSDPRKNKSQELVKNKSVRLWRIQYSQESLNNEEDKTEEENHPA